MPAIQSKSLYWFQSVPVWKQFEARREANKARTDEFLANTNALGNNLGSAMVSQATGMGDVYLQIAADRIKATAKPTDIIDQLRTLVEIVNSGSLSKASQNLNKPESVLSKNLKQLEDQIGGPIFVRGASTMRLTADGQRMLNFARAQLATLPAGT